MNIAFDVDNVLADTFTVWASKVHKKYGMRISLADIRSHKNPGSGYLENWQTYQLLDEVWNDWEKLPLSDENISGILEQVSEMEFSIDIATSRPERSMPNVKKWLELHGIHYDTFYGIGPRNSKREIKSNYLVDDAPEHIRDFANTGRIAIVYNKPWNLTVKGANIVRISSFEEIIDFLRERAQKKNLNRGFYSELSKYIYEILHQR